MSAEQYKAELPQLRKCCKTQKGKHPHESSCLNHPNNMTSRQRSYRDMKDTFDRCGIGTEIRKEILDDVYGDLPDGAYLAMAEEFGLSPEDLVD